MHPVVVPHNITGHSFRSGRTEKIFLNSNTNDRNNSDLYLLVDQAKMHDLDRNQILHGIKHREIHSLAYNDIDPKVNSKGLFPPLKRRY